MLTAGGGAGVAAWRGERDLDLLCLLSRERDRPREERDEERLGC